MDRARRADRLPPILDENRRHVGRCHSALNYGHAPKQKLLQSPNAHALTLHPGGTAQHLTDTLIGPKPKLLLVQKSPCGSVPSRALTGDRALRSLLADCAGSFMEYSFRGNSYSHPSTRRQDSHADSHAGKRFCREAAGPLVLEPYVVQAQRTGILFVLTGSQPLFVVQPHRLLPYLIRNTVGDATRTRWTNSDGIRRGAGGSDSSPQSSSTDRRKFHGPSPFHNPVPRQMRREPTPLSDAPGSHRTDHHRNFVTDVDGELKDLPGSLDLFAWIVKEELDVVTF